VYRKSGLLKDTMVVEGDFGDEMEGVGGRAKEQEEESKSSAGA